MWAWTLRWKRMVKHPIKATCRRSLFFFPKAQVFSSVSSSAVLGEKRQSNVHRLSAYVRRHLPELTWLRPTLVDILLCYVRLGNRGLGICKFIGTFTTFRCVPCKSALFRQSALMFSCIDDQTCWKVARRKQISWRNIFWCYSCRIILTEPWIVAKTKLMKANLMIWFLMSSKAF